MHSFYLENVTTPVLYKMFEELRAGGSSIDASPMNQAPYNPPAFNVCGSGIRALVQYDPGTLRATVTIQDKPFLVPYSLIEQKVREALRVASAA